MIKTIISKEILFYFRRRGEMILPLLFFVMVTSLFAIAYPQDPKGLATIAPIILWTIAILSLLFSVETSYRSDFQDGTLEQLIVSPCSLTSVVIGKSVAQWLMLGVPLTLMVPFLALSMHVSSSGIVGLMVTFALGIPLLSLLASLGVALTIALHRGGIFLSILILPLLIPVVLIALSGVKFAMLGLNWSGQVALLLAMLIIGLMGIPALIASALRISIQSG